MSRLDPRLLPLVETLAAVGADWLAFELIAGLQRGVELEEPESALASAREQVRSGEQRSREFPEVMKSPKQILGNEQIDWAATYVVQRIESTLGYLKSASESLNVIAAMPSKRGGGEEREGGEQQYSELPLQPIRIVIADDEIRTVSNVEIEIARNALDDLRIAIDGWSRQIRE